MWKQVLLLVCVSDRFVKPNLWLMVDPSIACPIQYAHGEAGLQTLSEAVEEGQTRLPDPADTLTELYMYTPHGAPLQEELLPPVRSSTEFLVK